MSDALIASISASQQAATSVELQVAVMKKTRAVEQVAAEALVDLVKAAMPSHIGSRLNVVA